MGIELADDPKVSTSSPVWRTRTCAARLLSSVLITNALIASAQKRSLHSLSSMDLKPSETMA